MVGRILCPVIHFFTELGVVKRHWIFFNGKRYYSKQIIFISNLNTSLAMVLKGHVYKPSFMCKASNIHQHS